MADALPNPPRLRLRVTATAESMIRGGHPWLYDASIREQNRPGQPGELAVLFDRSDKFLALGLYDPLSPIRVRVLHCGKPVTADDNWWRARLQTTLARRDGLFDAQTTGHRCISGESDGWPGLVLDRYDTTFVLKLYSAAWLPRVGEVVGWLREALQPERLVLRLSRNIQSLAEKEFNLREGQMLIGDAPQGPVVFLETGIRFEAEVIRGQKTGFFLDQRENRRRVETLAAGRDVLNAFSFSGGFSLYAARGGARSTTDLDISSHALDSARRNFALNAANPHIAACRHECAQADTFDWLAASIRADFDLIVLDRPHWPNAKPSGPGRFRRIGDSRCSASHACDREEFSWPPPAPRTSPHRSSTTQCWTRCARRVGSLWSSSEPPTHRTTRRHSPRRSISSAYSRGWKRNLRNEERS